MSLHFEENVILRSNEGAYLANVLGLKELLCPPPLPVPGENSPLALFAQQAYWEQQWPVTYIYNTLGHKHAEASGNNRTGSLKDLVAREGHNQCDQESSLQDFYVVDISSELIEGDSPILEATGPFKATI